MQKKTGITGLRVLTVEITAFLILLNLQYGPFLSSSSADSLMIIYHQDFERNDGGYASGGVKDSWQWGDVEAAHGIGIPLPPGGGTMVWATNISGPYRSGSYQYLISPPINVEGYQNLTLRITIWLDITVTDQTGNPLESPSDTFKIRVSKDGDVWEDEKVINGVWEGEKTWYSLNIELNGYFSKLLYLNFTLMDQPSGYEGFGAYIDDISVLGSPTPPPHTYFSSVHFSPLLSPGETEMVQAELVKEGSSSNTLFSINVKLLDHLDNVVEQKNVKGNISIKESVSFNITAPRSPGIYTLLLSLTTEVMKNVVKWRAPISIGQKILLDGFTSPPTSIFSLEGLWSWEENNDYIYGRGAIVSKHNGTLETPAEERMGFMLDLRNSSKVYMGVIHSYNLPSGSLALIYGNGDQIFPDGGYPSTVKDPITGFYLDGYQGYKKHVMDIFDISSLSGGYTNVTFSLKHNKTAANFLWEIDALYVFSVDLSGSLEYLQVFNLNINWSNEKILSVSWDPLPNKNVAGYLVFLSITPFTSIENLEPYLDVRGRNKTTVLLSGLDPNKVCYIAVVGENYKGEYPTNVVSVKVPGWSEVSNHPPVAVIESPKSGTVDEMIYLDGSSSYDPDGDNISYKWDFGDGEISTVKSPMHTYENKGDYTITLTVSDGKGGFGNTSVNITIYEKNKFIFGSFFKNLGKYLPSLTLFIVVLLILIFYLLYNRKKREKMLEKRSLNGIVVNKIKIEDNKETKPPRVKRPALKEIELIPLLGKPKKEEKEIKEQMKKEEKVEKKKAKISLKCPNCGRSFKIEIDEKLALEGGEKYVTCPYCGKGGLMRW